MAKQTAIASFSHEAQLLKLARLRTVSDLWDRALGIPGTQWRLGLESLAGLLPVGGDVVGLAISIYILWQAVEFNLPKSVLLRMVSNIAIDALVGAVPILGDLFDIAWQANTKNVNLLESHLQQPIKSRSADRRFLWLLFGGLLLALVALSALAIVVLVWAARTLAN
jgi:hypothetical protein